MADAPTDLLAARARIRALTQLPAVGIGIVGDPAHLAGGGYHVGETDLIHIGGYGPAGATAGHVRQTRTDYSVRLGRDRAGCTEDASAMDIGDAWPAGGRAAWLRFNRLLVRALQTGDPALGAVRAVNFSRDGFERKRIDREYGFGVIEDSLDSVTIHTHIEWYRDTAGRRQPSLDRLVDLVDAAINATTPPPAGTDEQEDEGTMSMIPAGFGADELGDGLPGLHGKTVVVTVDPSAGKVGYVSVGAEFGSAKLRIGAGEDGHGPATRHPDVTVSNQTGRKVVYQTPVGVGAVVSIVRMRTSATDTADDIPVGVGLRYV